MTNHGHFAQVTAPPRGNRLTLFGMFNDAVLGAIYYALDLESPGEERRAKSGVTNVITKRTARWSKLAALAAGALILAAMTIGPSYAANNTEVYIVQGLPGKDLDVEIDGESVVTGVKTAAVAGPFKVKPGKRTVTSARTAR